MTRLSFVLFFSVFLSVYLGMHYYVFTRIANGLALAGALRLTLRIIFLFGAASFFVSEFVMRRSESALVKPLVSFSMVWLGAIAMALALFVLTDALRIAFRGPAFRYYSTVGALVLLGLMTAYSVYNVAAWRTVREFKLTIPKLPARLSGFSIVQLSDIHLNSFSSPAGVKRMVDEANALKPDLIVITGDLVDADILRFPDIYNVLKGLNAKHGVYIITGNHEYYTGLDRFARLCKELGFTLLRNGVTTVADGAIQIVGIDDHISALGPRSEPQLKEIAGGIDPAKPSILLAHRPDTFDAAAKLGFDLQLSGHTHAGQIPPMDLIVLMYFSYPVGLYTKGNSYCYVTTGTGYWGPPMRVFSTSEIVKFTLMNK